MNLDDYEKVGEVKVSVDEPVPYSGLGDTVSFFKKKEPKPKVKCKELPYPVGVIIDGELWVL